MSGSRADGSPIFASDRVDVAALLGTRPRACRPYRAKTKGKVERVIREVKEDFLALADQAGLPRATDPRLVRRYGSPLDDRGRRYA
jgi:transposase